MIKFLPSWSTSNKIWKKYSCSTSKKGPLIIENTLSLGQKKIFLFFILLAKITNPSRRRLCLKGYPNQSIYLNNIATNGEILLNLFSTNLTTVTIFSERELSLQELQSNGNGLKVQMMGSMQFVRWKPKEKSFQFASLAVKSI